MRKFQIGVMGSAADVKYSKITESAAEEIGYLIAGAGNENMGWSDGQLSL